jgi:hypothetical protein
MAVFCTVFARFCMRSRTPVICIVYKFLVRLLVEASISWTCLRIYSCSQLLFGDFTVSDWHYISTLPTNAEMRKADHLMSYCSYLRPLRTISVGIHWLCTTMTATFSAICTIQGPCPTTLRISSIHGLCTNTLTSRVSIVESNRSLLASFIVVSTAFRASTVLYKVALRFCKPMHCFAIQSNMKSHPVTTSTSCSLASRAENRWLGTLRLAA